jgi:hypothetical protein
MPASRYVVRRDTPPAARLLMQTFHVAQLFGCAARPRRALARRRIWLLTVAVKAEI